MSKFNVKFLLVSFLFFNSSFALDFNTNVDLSDIEKISIENPTKEIKVIKEDKKIEKDEKIIQKTKTNIEIKESKSPSPEKNDISEIKKEIIKEPLKNEVVFIQDENKYLKNIVTVSQEVLTTY
jgi:hypothetical protein